MPSANPCALFVAVIRRLAATRSSVCVSGCDYAPGQSNENSLSIFVVNCHPTSNSMTFVSSDPNLGFVGNVVMPDDVGIARVMERIKIEVSYSDGRQGSPTKMGCPFSF